MNDKYVTEYAQGIAERKYCLADGLWHAEYIMRQYEAEIWDKLEELGVVYASGDEKNHDKWRLQDIEWDHYDCSIELIDCVDGFTLTTAQRDAINAMGFQIIFCNYKDGPHLYGKKTAAMNAMPVIKD